MATAIINSQMDAINESFSNISSDLTTIRPLLKNASIGAYPTDTASGSIASFTDGAEGIPVKSLSVDLEPIQNLNGYDSPWPAGGGKNKLDMKAIIPVGDYSANGSVFSWNSQIAGRPTLVLSDTDQDYILTWENGSYSGTATNVRLEFYDTANTLVSSRYMSETTPYTVNGVSKVKVNYGNNGTGSISEPMLRLATEADATFAPYSNICPISGHTEVNVYKTGVNVWDEEWENGAISGLTGGTYNDSTKIRSLNYIPVQPSTAYYLKAPAILNIAWYDANKEYISGTKSASRNYARTSPAGARFLRFSCNVSTYSNDISINYPATDHEYHTYAGQTYNVPLGQTVYGGTLNVTTGLLTVDMAMVDLGTLTWGYDSNNKLFTAWKSGMKIEPSAKGRPCACSIYPSTYGGTWSGWGNFPDKHISSGNNYSGNSVDICVKDTSYTDAAAFKTAMNGVQLVYELATPTTVQLTATQVSTLLGANNIWSDAGSVDVVIRADTALFVEKMIAQAMNA